MRTEQTQRTATDLTLDEVLKAPSPGLDPTQTMASPTGHHVVLRPSSANEGSAALTVTGPRGEVQLRVELAAEGPILHFSAAEVRVHTAGAFRVDCDEIELSARSRMAFHSGGDLRQRAEALHEVSAGGRARIVGRDVRVAALRGDVEVRANDDVRVDGERIWLNR